MGVPVTIDSDDVQTLLFATGVTKAMAAAVNAASADEQFLGVKPKITDTHDRVANAWRDATRRQAFPNRYQPPTEMQKQMLIGLARRGATDKLGMLLAFDEAPKHRSLVAAGLVEIGVYQERVVWNVGSGDVTWAEKPRLRLTARAIEAIGGILELTELAPEAPPVPPRGRGSTRRRLWKRLWNPL